MNSSVKSSRQAVLTPLKLCQCCCMEDGETFPAQDDDSDAARERALATRVETLKRMISVTGGCVVTDLNPQYVWGGDAITLDDTDLVWIDHVTTSLIGRQHIVLGTSASNRVTISNCYINGATSWSATCDGHHYWNIYLDGSNDLVTMKDNYIYYTSGRAPKVAGNTLLHAVNNYWYQNSGHAFEVDAGGMVVVEGSVFQNVGAMVDSSVAGQIFTSPSTSANTACASYLGRDCQLNAFGSSTSYSGTDTSFFSDFSGKNVASADTASTAQADVPSHAGAGNL